MKRITQLLAIIVLLFMFSCEQLDSDRAKPAEEIKEKINIKDSIPTTEMPENSTQ